MKDEIIKILKNYEFDPAGGWDSQDRHIDDSDFDKIADDFIKLIIKNIINDAIKDVDFRETTIGAFTKGSFTCDMKPHTCEATVKNSENGLFQRYCRICGEEM